MPWHTKVWSRDVTLCLDAMKVIDLIQRDKIEQDDHDCMNTVNVSNAIVLCRDCFDVDRCK